MKTLQNKGWLTEWFTPHELHSHHLKKVLVKKTTKFQKALVADTFSFGRCLVLDGEMQSAQLDEFIYHESLVHPGLLTHPAPKKVAILGGGEGATLREILKHKTIEKVYMVDIDGEVVDFCEKYMEPWHKGTFKDPRSKVIIGDAKKFIEETTEKFDLIISDLPTPIEGGPAYQLYTVEFYRILKKRLTPNGLVALQAGSGNLLQIDFHLKLYRTLKQVFPVIRPYASHVPSFDVPWAFLLCSQNKSQDPHDLTEAEVNRRLAKRVRGTLQFYDGMTHEGLMRIPKHIRAMLAAEKGIISRKRPVYFFK